MLAAAGRSRPCQDARVAPVGRRLLSTLLRPLERVTEPVHGLLNRLLAPRSIVLDSAPIGATVKPEAQPYAGGSGEVAVLLCHGFSGSPKSMIGWAKHLEAAGFRVSVPRLPGHGTSWQEMNRTEWTDWYGCVDDAFAELVAQCRQVFVGGLSMGAALALRLAEQHPGSVSGLILVNPVIKITDLRIHALPVLHRLVPSLYGIANDIAMPGQNEGGYDRNPLRALYSMTKMTADIRAHLPEIDQPLLVYRSRVDHVADPSSVRLLRDTVASSDQTYVELTRSFHVATLDYDSAQIFDGSVEFCRRLTKD
jgi:carboxylesterase